jgi:hypothetical protein
MGLQFQPLIRTLFRRLALLPQFSDALWASYDDVDQRADPLQQKYYQDPNDLVISLRRLVLDTIDKRPNPKHKEANCQDGEQAEEATKRQ